MSHSAAARARSRLSGAPGDIPRPPALEYRFDDEFEHAQSMRHFGLQPCVSSHDGDTEYICLRRLDQKQHGLLVRSSGTGSILIDDDLALLLPQHVRQVSSMAATTVLVTTQVRRISFFTSGIYCAFFPCAHRGDLYRSWSGWAGKDILRLRSGHSALRRRGCAQTPISKLKNFANPRPKQLWR